MDPRVMELRIKKWLPIMEAQANSGMTKKEWCAQNGIERTSFYRWQRRVRTYLIEHGNSYRNQEAITALQEQNEYFVELPSRQVSLVDTVETSNNENNPADSGNTPIRIHYGDYSVSVNRDFDESQLIAVLRVLKHVD